MNLAASNPHTMDLARRCCTHCGVTHLQLLEHGPRPCVRGLWPLDVAVPFREVRRA